ncbi:hypothetical protein OKW45_007832 [Paraburkholderia sp. WSM4175]
MSTERRRDGSRSGVRHRCAPCGIQPRAANRHDKVFANKNTIARDLGFEQNKRSTFEHLLIKGATGPPVHYS